MTYAPRPLQGSTPLPALDDREGSRVPAGLPPVIDAHVHLFPDPAWGAIRGWFDEHAWPVRYRMGSREAVRFLLDRGVERVVALHYAHRPGLARGMNAHMAAICRDEPRVTGLATVYPGEENADALLEEAFASGLSGLKLHLHVIGMPLDHPGVVRALEVTAAAGHPAVVHAGREPSSPAYPRDTRAICGVDRVARVLDAVPSLRLCVPHLGGDEFDAFAELMADVERLWLDTTMMLAGYFPYPERWDLLRRCPDRILYGTDFPNIPYAWDRELRRLAAHGLAGSDLEGILAGNARSLFDLPPCPPGSARFGGRPRHELGSVRGPGTLAIPVHAAIFRPPGKKKSRGSRGRLGKGPQRWTSAKQGTQSGFVNFL